MEIQDCKIKECPDPMWTAWSISECSVTCGYGKKTKTRKCEDFFSGEELDPILECKATGVTDYIQIENCEKAPCKGKNFLTM